MILCDAFYKCYSYNWAFGSIWCSVSLVRKAVVADRHNPIAVITVTHVISLPEAKDSCASTDKPASLSQECRVSPAAAH